MQKSLNSIEQGPGGGGCKKLGLQFGERVLGVGRKDYPHGVVLLF